MKHFLFLVFLLSGILETGTACAEEVKFLHPVFLERDAVLIDNFRGTWKTEFAGLVLSISPGGDNFYALAGSEEGKWSEYEATLIPMGRDLILDLLPVFSEARETDFAKGHQVTAHSVFLVHLLNDTMYLSGLSYRWFLERIKNKNLSVPFAWYDKMLLLTASTGELQEFLRMHINDRGFWDSPLVLSRLEPNSTVTKSSIDDKPRTEVLAAGASVRTPPACIPRFPYSDGWLGGDGDLSVPLSPTRTLWIFSDSYVGKKDQRARQGAGMVSNTVAISDCDSNGNWSIRYFWRNQYSDNPEPIFQSHTKRYLYWPNEAFMLNDVLYVVLHKIGIREGGNPDDLFNFSLTGTTLARISNVRTATPDQWDIHLIPWSSVYDPNTCNAAIMRDNEYLYAFMGRERQKAYLTRLRLDRLSEPKNNIEFFARDRSWKRGLHPENAMILIEDLIGGSVRYHDDIKKWVMVYGPNLFSNKVLMRTAPRPTGPWTQAVTLYECPEQVPVATTDPKDCACYCGREHAQFYNTNGPSLMITYDCNGRRAVERMDIYSPRVLAIPIKNLLQNERK